jgi:ribosomal protein L3
LQAWLLKAKKQPNSSVVLFVKNISKYMTALKGKKLNMTQIWKDDQATAITLIKVTDKSESHEFKTGDLVTVSGKTKGRGFQGVVKRHGFAGGPKTHGQKNRWRAPGSIGATAPQRVIMGTRMAGRMGGQRVTLKNLTIIDIDVENNIISLKGAVPGSRGTVVEIIPATKSVKA